MGDVVRALDGGRLIVGRLVIGLGLGDLHAITPEHVALQTKLRRLSEHCIVASCSHPGRRLVTRIGQKTSARLSSWKLYILYVRCSGPPEDELLTTVRWKLYDHMGARIGPPLSYIDHTAPHKLSCKGVHEDKASYTAARM
ncbi:hypothetical protein TRAPUB_2179 [Trametes pubescens]|uniref:Uncharacterized protein n=1 Tax=Trametes pubescens TaxID=154538 RepID=A0A1M2VHA6_TRAPU|nr:hypothetical protein TRAPUB_2179 [Trametes pubescens]